ncbi:MAG: hypothetical protein DRN15_02690 [Thermoprotei archaeon]|nr:MAG: hypothetical protein DRN15_02690 [Thermoprotei archaeon]
MIKSILKYCVYIVIIIGVIIYIWWVYQAATSIKIEDVMVTGFEPLSPFRYRVEVEVVFNNPTGTAIEAEFLIYQVYIYSYYIGEGFKPRLVIKPGMSSERFTYELDIRYLPWIMQRTIAEEGVINVTVTGWVTVPLKAFGIFTWREVRMPYKISRKVNVTEATRNALLTSLRGISPEEILSRMRDLESKISKLLEEISRLKGSLIDPKRIEDLEERVNTLRTDLDSLKSKMEQLIQMMNTLSSEIKGLEKTLARLEREVQEIREILGL